MDKIEKGFREALKKNEDDVETRLVYADWLDEQGKPEEADRQRKWHAARIWMEKFAKKWNFFDAAYQYGSEEYDDVGEPIENETGNSGGWKELVDMAASEQGIGRYGLLRNYVVAHGKDIHSRGELGSDYDLFWENMEILTGKKFDETHRDNLGWSCSC